MLEVQKEEKETAEGRKEEGDSRWKRVTEGREEEGASRGMEERDRRKRGRESKSNNFILSR